MLLFPQISYIHYSIEAAKMPIYNMYQFKFYQRQQEIT